jgi:hypothetical protein
MFNEMRENNTWFYAINEHQGKLCIQNRKELQHLIEKLPDFSFNSVQNSTDVLRN